MITKRWHKTFLLHQIHIRCGINMAKMCRITLKTICVECLEGCEFSKTKNKNRGDEMATHLHKNDETQRV